AAATRTSPPGPVVRDRGHNPIVTTRWTRTMGSSTVLEARGGYMYAIDKNTPPNGDFETPGRFNISTGDYSVNIQSASYSTFQKPSLAAALTHHASDFLKGSHEFKFGVQFAPQNSIVGSGPFMGNKFYYDLGGLPYYVLVREPNANAGRVATSGVFVQDNWTTDRVTLNLGVRFDHTSADVPATNQRDAQFEETDHVYAAIPDLIGFNDMYPRVGVTVTLYSTG